MNRAFGLLTTFAFVAAAFGGCFGEKTDDTPEDTSGSVDETATYDGANADQAFKVSGTLAGPGVSLTTGAVELAAVDAATTDDSAGALDKANLTLDVTEADGTRIQASLRAMTTAAEAGMPTADFYGGVNHNFEMNGDTGAGVPEFPKGKSYVFFAGLARLAVNGAPLDDLALVTAWAGKGIRGPDGALLRAAEDGDLEVHVVFPGSLVPGAEPVNAANGTDGFLYYYFERVQLNQLTVEEKAEVGSKLQAPRATNQPPVAAAAVILPDGTTSGMGTFDPIKKLNITLDASNSTDADGAIEAYSWSVSEYNETGILVDFNKTSGVKVNILLNTPGLKRIDLRVIDELGGIGNTTLFFYANYKATFAHTFGAAEPPQTVSGGQSCVEGLNCISHRFTVYYGAQAASFKMPAMAGGSQCNTPHIDLWKPGGTAAFKTSTSEIKLTAADLTSLGAWQLKVWYQAQAQCKYTQVSTVDYAPPAPAA